MSDQVNVPATSLRMPAILRLIWREWMGDGPVLGRGNFAEFLWANFGNLQIGVLILLYPAWAAHSHGLALMLWRWPIWAVGGVFILSGLFTDLGLVLSFFRGRCVASRLARLVGASLGFWIWLCILGSVWQEGHASYIAVATSQLGTVAYLRTVCLAWRRYPVRTAA